MTQILAKLIKHMIAEKEYHEYREEKDKLVKNQQFEEAAQMRNKMREAIDLLLTKEQLQAMLADLYQ